LVAALAALSFPRHLAPAQGMVALYEMNAFILLLRSIFFTFLLPGPVTLLIP
jgi:hypothetical protein